MFFSAVVTQMLFGVLEPVRNGTDDIRSESIPSSSTYLSFGIIMKDCVIR